MVLENVCAVLVLPSPPNNCFANDWYWRRICGVPFLMRNVFNLQRVGLNFLLIYSNENNAKLYKQLCEEKKIFIKLIWTTDVSEVTRLTKNYSILVLNGGALYTKQEIQSGRNFSVNSSESSTKFLERNASGFFVHFSSLPNPGSPIKVAKSRGGSGAPGIQRR